MPFEKDRPQRLRARLHRMMRPGWLGLPRSTKPLSYQWGAERGTPVDRYYIERFFAEHAGDIQGHVLEIAEDSYTRRFGSAVQQVDVLDIDRGNPRATLFADLSQPNAVPASSVDCFILTQTLHLIYDFKAVLQNAHSVLKPRGVLLASMPVVSRLSDDPPQEDFWRFTPLACARLVGEFFGSANVQVASYGNVLTASAFLYGLATEDLSRRELEFSDPLFSVVACVRAVKST